MSKMYQRIWAKAKERWPFFSKNAPMKIYSYGIVGTVTIATFLSLSGTAPALDPGALPTGGKIIAGSGNISTSGSQMTVNQSTNKMIANWNTFNIGKNAGATFRQPDSDAIVLNRIYDQNPSLILGSLSANGKVFLLNPSGIVFGKGSQVNVGGLVASSLNMLNSDFLAGNYTFLNTGNAGSVINRGNITAANGGVVALLAPKVTNEGTITANDGSVIMAAGNQVSLDFNGDGLISYTIDKGAVDALAENSGFIKADGGMVVMTAEAANSLTGAVVNNTGVIQAQTLDNKAGRIMLLSDMANGTTNVGGKLDASAPNSEDGGFIETSAKNVKINDEAVITTAAPKGKTGTWLIDPYDFTIAASGGDVTGAALTTALASSSVTIQTLSGSVSCTGVTCGSGNSSGNGDIFVNDNITWSQNTLTLNAYRNIEINSELFGSGTAQLSLLYGQGAVALGNTAIYDVNAPVNLPAGNNFSTKLGSNGTTVSYYVITNLGADGSRTGTDLQGIQGFLARNYALGGNIDATETSGWDTGKGFSPLGNTAGMNVFTGQFDGLGHSITNLTINRPSQNGVGLFGYISPASILRNVGLLGGSVSGYYHVGGLVGGNEAGTIMNAYSTGSVTGGGYSVGGLVGYNNSGTIQNTYSTGSVSGSCSIPSSYYVGGLVGYNYRGTITNAYSTGSVTGAAFVGGLVGGNDYGTIQNAYSTGSVTPPHAYVGGLVGYSNAGTILCSFWNTTTSDVGVERDSWGATGLTTAQMKTMSSFVGWDIANTGGTSAVWRIYEGNTYPLLRSFLTPLTVTANDDSKTYDKVAYNGGNGVTYSIASPTLSGSLTYSGTSQGAINAGNYAITPGGYYSDQQGYDIRYAGSTLTINKAPLSITAKAVKNKKMYDGTTSAAALPIVTITDGQLFGTDTLVATETYDNKNVGRRKTLTANVIVNDDNDGNNYDCIMTIIDNYKGKIKKAKIYITAQSNAKTYDATTSAAAIPTVSGLMVDDTVTNLSETYRNKNVGTGKTLKVASYTVNDGNSGYNYKVKTIRNTIGVITPAPLTITAITNTKTYDATTSAEAIPTVSGVLGSDTVTNLKETYDNKNAGAGKTMSVARYTIRDGNWGKNYTVNTVNDTTGVINPALLTVTAVQHTKTYDGTTSATAKPVITAGKIYGSDKTNFIETYDNKNVGTGKTLTPSGTMNDGNGGNNYSYTFLTNNTGVINKATLYITAQPNTKLYDGTTSAIAIPTVVGLKGTDTVTNLAEIYSNANIGTRKTLYVADYSVNDDNSGNNYTVKKVNNTRGVITQ